MLYPINLNIKKQPCLIVGGGEVALRKVQTLLECQARVTVIAPQVHPMIRKLARKKHITLIQRNYRVTDLIDLNPFLVIGATNNNSVNRRIAADAKKKMALVNIVDVPELCNFQVPASFRRGALLFTISTAGRSPTLAKHLRVQLEQEFGPEYADFVELLGKWRKKIIRSIRDGKLREQIFTAIVESDIVELLRMGFKKEAELRMRQIQEARYKK